MPRRDPKVVRAIQAASQRMLDGNPIEVEVGRLSVIALSEESGVARTRLNREYKEERDAHTLAVLRAQAPGEPTTPRERELRDQVATLTDQVEVLNDQRLGLSQLRDSWKQAAEHFIRAAHVKQVEVNRLREKDAVSMKVRARLKNDLEAAIARPEQAEFELLQREAQPGQATPVRSLRPVGSSDIPDEV